MEHEIELQVMPSGNVAVYRGNGFIPTEKLTEEERLFVLDKVIKELGGEHKVNTRDSSLEDEIKRYTEEKYHETFGNGQGTLDEFDWEDIAVTIEETAVHFAGWKEKAPEYKTISKILALGFMHCLDENRPEGKMCLSNGECADIEKAFNEQDWLKLARYLGKYLIDGGSSEIPKDLEEAAEHYASVTDPEAHGIDFIREVFIAGEECQYQKDRAEFAKLKAKEWSDGYNEGIAKGKEQMIKEAVEATLDNTAYPTRLWFNTYLSEYSNNDKVRVIIVKED